MEDIAWQLQPQVTGQSPELFAWTAADKSWGDKGQAMPAEVSLSEATLQHPLGKRPQKMSRKFSLWKKSRKDYKNTVFGMLN